MEKVLENSQLDDALKVEELQRQVELRRLLKFIDCLIGVVVVAICVQGGRRFELL